MLGFAQVRNAALWFTGILCIVAIGACSKESERSRTAESASSPGTRDTARDTTPAPADTTPAPGSTSSTDTAKPATQTSGQRATLPKPSIDPGRKRTGARISPNAAKPAVDTAASDTAAKPAPTGAAPEFPGDQYLKYDAGTNTVTFELVAGPFVFNGHGSGSATLVLPSKANVVINFINKDGTPHSAEVISGEGPIPNSAVDPAIPRAYTTKVLEGLAQEAGDVMRFTVPESGSYRIFCGVPGHGLSGMWIWMKVDPAAKQPSFGPTKG